MKKNKRHWTLASSAILCMTLCACTVSEIISDVVETGIRQTTVNNRNTTTPASVSKEQQRETERLKQQGKCPICKGIGKTADGRYDCAACHGPGKYQEENKKAE